MKQNLNFSWSFIRGFGVEFLTKLPPEAVKVDLPHCPVKVPATYFDEQCYQDLFTYEITFDDDDPEPIKTLVFEGAMLKIHVYLNDADLGEQISSYFPTYFDVTKVIKPKANRLVVVLDSREDPSIPPFGKAVDYLTFAGIYRDVHLDGHPLCHMDNLSAYCNDKGHIRISYDLKGPMVNDEPHFSIYEGTQLIKEFTGKDAYLDHPHLWSLDDPFLYRLEAVYQGEKTSINVGFRTVYWNEEGFFLNHKKVKLIGLNRHQNYPYVGPSLPKAAQIDDAEILKHELGVNVVRTSHYADAEEFLDACDRLGLLLIDEVPGWQYVGKDKAWRTNFLSFVERLIKKERKHPCLIAYGLRIDESADDHDLYSAAVQKQKELDPYRQNLGVRNFKGSECLEDIYAYNDFSCSSIKHGLDDPKTYKAPERKALLVTEFNGHMYPTKPYDILDRRLSQALRHAKVLDDSFKFKNLSGAIGWCAFDYNTHKDFGSGDHVCYHGVSDIYRNPKLAAFVYKSQTQKNVFVVSSPMAVGDNDECLMKPAYVFTDADYVELYRNDCYISRFYPDRKNFPNLPHAPIKVDDFIGGTFQEPRFSKRDYPMMKKSLNQVAAVGFSRIKTVNKLFLAKCLVKYHLSFDDLTAIYAKYISSWGERAAIWHFVGIKEGKTVGEQYFGPSLSFKLEVKPTKTELVNDVTYDCARISLRKLDQYNNPMVYSFDPVSVSTTGPIEVLGPTTFSLVGGSSCVYVRSHKVARKTKASLTIASGDETQVIEFVVE